MKSKKKETSGKHFNIKNANVCSSMDLFYRFEFVIFTQIVNCYWTAYETLKPVATTDSCNQISA